MKAADRFNKMVKEYWESEEIKEKTQICVDVILKRCEEQARQGKTSYRIDSTYSSVEYFSKVVEALRKEELNVLSLEHVEFGVWLVSW